MKEIQVVIMMGGYGYSLFPFTEKTPKQLLPVANKPFIAYLLEKLQNHFFTNFIFLCNEENKIQIENYVKQKFQWPRKLPKNLVFYSTQNYQADSRLLAEIYQQKILTKDFLLINADSLSSVNLNELVDFHYLNDNDITSCFIKNPNSNQFLITNCQNQRIIKFLDKEQLDFDKFIGLSEANVSNNKQMEFLLGYKMVNIHLCNIKVAKIIANVEQKFYEFGDEILPFIIDNQYNQKLIKEYNQETAEEDKISQDSSDFQNLQTYKPLQIKPFLFTGIHNQITNITEYKEINLKAIGFQKNQELYKPTANNLINLGIDEKVIKKFFSIIASGTFLNPSAKLEKSIIGKNCVINNCQIKNSILMNDVTIEDNVKLEDCLIGSNVIIKNGMSLNDCTLGDGLVVDINEEMHLEGELLSELDNPVEVIRKNSESINQLQQLYIIK